MKRNNWFTKPASIMLMASVALISSCNDEDRLTMQDTQDITEETLTDTFFQDIDDLSGVAVSSPSDTEYNGGRMASTITIQDDRFQCQGIIVTLNSTGTIDNPQGTISIDFGAGCADLRGNIRKGKLNIAYNGKRFMPGSTVTTTTDNYYINGVKLEGTRTSTNVQNSNAEAPKFTVTLVNGKATFEDQTVATRESEITWSWIRAANPSQDQLVIESGSWAEGVTRYGRSYEVSVLDDLLYRRGCFMAVDGVKKYIIDGSKEVIIDYGTGDCDQSVLVTVNGVTRSLSISQ
jgi:hypothetical protein